MSRGPRHKNQQEATAPPERGPCSLLNPLQGDSNPNPNPNPVASFVGEKQGGAGSMDSLQGRPLELVWARVSDIPQTPS